MLKLVKNENPPRIRGVPNVSCNAASTQGNFFQTKFQKLVKAIESLKIRFGVSKSTPKKSTSEVGMGVLKLVKKLGECFICQDDARTKSATMCNVHYLRRYKHGSPLVERIVVNPKLTYLELAPEAYKLTREHRREIAKESVFTGDAKKELGEEKVRYLRGREPKQKKGETKGDK